MARKYPNDFTPDGVDIETAFANDDLELKDILSQIANVGAINLSGEKRQSVLSAHVDSSGNPDYITATGLNVSIDGSTTPVILAFAAGFDDKGSVDLVDAIKTSVSAWTVPSNSTVYLYVDKDASTGLLSYGYSTLPDLYQKAAPAAVLDQHWYDTNACKMRRYNGSAWEEKRRVFVGKVVAGATTAVVTLYPLKTKAEAINSIPYNRQLYSTAGTYTFVAPNDGLYDVTVIGGGGGSGGVTTTTTQTAASGGGGGGGCAVKKVSLTAGQTVSVTVGAGGTTAVGTNGGNGGTSSFGAFCSATGGLGSAKADSNSVVAGGADVTGGTNGGNGSNGDLNFNGGCGGDPTPEVYGSTGGYQIFYEAKGGDSYLNKGQRSGNGAFGSGASGRAWNFFSGYVAGYAGGTGIVIIEW